MKRSSSGAEMALRSSSHASAPPVDLAQYPAVKASQAADSLFACDWKPGFLVEDEHVVAVKLKKVSLVAELPEVFARLTNYVTPTRVFAFKDAFESTRLAFMNNVRAHKPVRVAVWSDADSKYVDRGWATPLEATQSFLIFDISPDVQSSLQAMAYPCRKGHVDVPSSRHVEYAGHVFDSLLEARHAVFFGELGIEYEPHPRSFATPFGNWAIDFKIALPQAGSVVYVEIKPTEPLLEEEQRAISAAYQVSHPVVILYGDMGAPWARESSKSAVAYDRKKPGVRGILYTVHSGALVRANVVWCEPHPGTFVLRSIHTPFCDLSWESPALVRAYEKAHGALRGA